MVLVTQEIWGLPLAFTPLCFPFLRLTPFPWVLLYQVIPSVCWWQSQHSALFAQLQTLLSGERDPGMMLSSVQMGTEAGGARSSARTAPRKGKKTHSISPRGLEGAERGAERAGSGPGSSRQRCSWTAPWPPPAPAQARKPPTSLLRTRGCPERQRGRRQLGVSSWCRIPAVYGK